MRQLTSEEYHAFVAAKPAAAIHFDADWNAQLREMTRLKMLEAELALDDRVSFGEIDCDAHLGLAKSIPVCGVPVVAYYQNGELVAALIGATQNVRARLERVLRGEEIGYKDG